MVAALWLHRLTVPHALLVAAVLGATMAYGGPVRMLAIRAVVPPAQLRQALAQDELRVNGAALVGPPLGGFLLGLGSAIPFLTTAVTSLLALGASWAVRFESPAPTGRDAGRGAVLEGMRYLFSRRLLRSTLLVTLAMNLAGSALLLAVMVRLRDGGTSGTGIGLALTGEAVGGLLGAPLVTRLHRRLAPGALLLAVAWLAVPMFLVPAATAAPAAVFGALAVMMLGVPALRVMVDVLIFQQVPDELRGRVMAATMTLLMVGMPVGTFVAGLLLDRFAAQTVLVALAALLGAGLLPATLGRSLRGTSWPA